MTKTFQVEKKGQKSWVVIRQEPHDPQYKIGSHIPSYGLVVDVREPQPNAHVAPQFAQALNAWAGIGNGLHVRTAPKKGGNR